MTSPSLIHGLLLATALVGCAQQRFSMRTRDYSPQKPVVFVPAMVALYSLDEYGDLHFHGPISKRSRVLTNKLLTVMAATTKSRVADLNEVSQASMPEGRFYTLLDNATTKIVVDWLDSGVTGPQPLSAWPPLGPEFTSWAPLLKTDYVVFVKLAGAYETDARHTRNTVTHVIGRGATVHARRMATLSVVDLRQGRIVRIEGAKFETVQTPEEIRVVLDDLMSALR